MSAAGSWLRRQRSTLLIVGGVLAAVLTVLVLGGAEQRTGAALDPANPGPDGARAVGRVLAGQGVEVTVVRSAEELEEERVDAATTVLVTSPELLGQGTARRLLAHASDGHLVLASPGPAATEALGLDELPFSVALDEPRGAGCDQARFDGLEILVDRAAEYPTTDGCFEGRHGVLIGTPAPGITLLGAASILENDQILRADNAAVALRLLGPRDRLVWYVPDLRDVSAGEGVRVASLLPRWLTPALWLAALSMVSVILWRSRRLGPLATEPLPVTVKAIETTRSRGRMYRRAADRAHASAALRRAARDRAADRLRLPDDSRRDPDLLIRDVARRLGRPVGEIHALLAPGAASPTNDADLITLATRLAALDREVGRP